MEANIESMVCTHFWKDKVNTTKYIKMVSITSIETKLVQKSQIQLHREWLLDLQSELDM